MQKLKRKNLYLLLVVALQIAYFAGWYWLETKKVDDKNGKIIWVENQAVDPRDVISGNYFAINYSFSSFQNFEDHRNINKDVCLKDKYKGKIYAILKKDEDIYKPSKLSLTEPILAEDEVALLGNYRVNFCNDYNKTHKKAHGTIHYGIEKYFINENIKEFARSDKVLIKLLVNKQHKAKILELTVNGKEEKEWKELYKK